MRRGTWSSSRIFIGTLVLVWLCALVLALQLSPEDTYQGEVMRILYVHVPASWCALGILTVMALSSALFIIFRMPHAEVFAEALAPLGALMTALSLITGALWGRSTWGTFWVWDARLTSTLVLLFLYGGIIGLRRAFQSPFSAQKPVAFLTLIAWLNVPLIKGSVVWFHTLHQPPSLVKATGPTLHAAFLCPLFGMMAVFVATLALLTSWRFELIQGWYKMRAQTQRQEARLIWAQPGEKP